MKTLSGKFVLRVGAELHSALRLAAKAHHVSLNEWIVRQLTGGDRGPSPFPVLERLKVELQSDLIGVVQFGSSVRGEMRSGSDVDLLVVLSENVPVARSLYATWDRLFPGPDEKIFSPQFSHLPKNENVSSLWLEVALEGEILIDHNHAIANKLSEIRRRIAAGEFVRKMSHGHPYWVRKED